MRTLSAILILLFSLLTVTLSAPLPSDPKNQKLFDSNNFKNKVRSGAVAAANKDKPQDGRVEGVRTKNGVGQSRMEPIVGPGAPQGPGGPGTAAGNSQGGAAPGGSQQAPSRPPKLPQQGMQRNPTAPSTVQSPPRGARREAANGGRTPTNKAPANNKVPAQQQGNQGAPKDRRGQMAMNGKQRSPFNKEFNSPAQKRVRGKGLGATSAAGGTQQASSSG